MTKKYRNVFVTENDQGEYNMQRALSEEIRFELRTPL